MKIKGEQYDRSERMKKEGKIEWITREKEKKHKNDEKGKSSSGDRGKTEEWRQGEEERKNKKSARDGLKVRRKKTNSYECEKKGRTKKVQW